MTSFQRKTTFGTDYKGMEEKEESMDKTWNP